MEGGMQARFVRWQCGSAVWVPHIVKSRRNSELLPVQRMHGRGGSNSRKNSEGKSTSVGTGSIGRNMMRTRRDWAMNSFLEFRRTLGHINSSKCIPPGICYARFASSIQNMGGYRSSGSSTIFASIEYISEAGTMPSSRRGSARIPCCLRRNLLRTTATIAIRSLRRSLTTGYSGTTFRIRDIGNMAEQE